MKTNNTDGFTVIEVLIAIMIFSVALLALAQLHHVGRVLARVLARGQRA